MNYQEFIKTKIKIDQPTGFEISRNILSDHHPKLFDYQVDILRWALHRGRCAVFADTGMGKTAIQLSWAWEVFQYTGNRVLILAPLCVAQQTEKESEKFAIGSVKYCREFDPTHTGIVVTNYDMIDHFEHAIQYGYFDGVVLDESSILKHQDSKTRKRLIELFDKVPFRLSCTATPSPNDHMELGGQAEFLGVMRNQEMLATFFTHDSGETSKWRLKGHARPKFWDWMSSWSIVIRKPSDLEYSDNGYQLPELKIIEVHTESSDLKHDAQGIQARIENKKGTLDVRISKAAELVNSLDGQCLVWCHLNSESSELKKLITDSNEVKGSDSFEKKETLLNGFTEGQYKVLITKPSIAGFGMNWQHCNQMVFVGLNDSYEQLYQAIRRCYRYGQTKPVHVYLICAPEELNVRENIQRKETQAEEMYSEIVKCMGDAVKKNLRGIERLKNEHTSRLKQGKRYSLYLGDCVEFLSQQPDNSIDFSVYSPPFSSLYTYSNSDYDMGNCQNDSQFFEQYKFLIREHFRTHKPGRNISIHCMNLPTSKQNHGQIGIRDFRGEIIRSFVEAGFIYHSECVIWKDPVVAMQRTKALGLLWKQIKKDSAMSRQGIPDYLVTFRKPGENPDRISHTPEEFPVDMWQQYASPCWMDIVQGNTLNKKLAREESDERHIAPLQLDLIERAIYLWSKPNDLIFSPFTGIGSEGYVALKMGRRFIGSELKESYFKEAEKNLEYAESLQIDLSIPKISDWDLIESSNENKPNQNIDEINQMHLF